MRFQTLRDLRLPKALTGDLARFDGDEDTIFLRGDVIVEDGRVTGMIPSAPTAEGGAILLPRFTEPHCHLDKCHTIGRLGHTGGDLPSAIEAQRADKANWTDADLRARASRGLAEYATAGTRLVRSHVDWGDDAPAPRSWSLLLELAQGTNTPKLQLSALTSIPQMVDPAFARTVARAIPQGHALGCFVYGHDNIETGLRHVFDAATRHGLPLDFHVDEGLDPALNGLETIADMALETGFDGPILCGHACSLATRTPAEVQRIADKLARAGIYVCLLPSTNLYLQGRRDGTPMARGVTLARELAAAGVRLVTGADNVRDAFCPLGRHDPLHSLELAILTAHLDPPLDRWLRAITTDAARAIGADPGLINGAPLDTLQIADARDLTGLISGAPIAPVPLFQRPTQTRLETKI